MKVSYRQRRILEALTKNGGEMFGLDLVNANAGSRSSIYVLLAQMEQLGWILGREVECEAPLIARRAYRITPIGIVQLLPEARTRK